MVFVIEDNEAMRGCIVRAARKAAPGAEVREFGDVVAAVQALDEGELPRLIFLDILLTGPDGFTFLNEIASYTDTAKIPVVVVSSLDFAGRDLSAYGVVGILNKETMTPEEIGAYARKYAGDSPGEAE